MKKVRELCTVILIAGLFILLFHSPFLSEIELELFDRIQAGHESTDQDARIVILAADDTSLSTLGRWPWPRHYYATALNVMYYFQPAAVGFDVLFTEQEISEPEEDTLFASMLAQTNNACLSYYFDFKTDTPPTTDRLALLENNKISGIQDKNAFLSARSVTLPVPELGSAAQLGYVNAPRDKYSSDDHGASIDGIIRDIPLLIEYNGNLYPSLVLQLILSYYGIKYDDLKIAQGKHISFTAPDGEQVSIPIDNKGRMLISYHGGLKSFRTIRFETVLSSAVRMSQQEPPLFDPDFFKDAIVLVGVTATGIDVGELPLKGRVAPLCLVHANAMHTILNRTFISRFDAPLMRGMTFTLIAVCGALAVFLPPLSALSASALLLGIIFGVYIFLLNHGIWITIVPAITGCIAAYLWITASHLITEEREKRRIKHMFGHYVSPNILEELIHNPGMLKLGGENRELTVLFSDIRGFTSYCETKSPEEVVSILNEYLDAMTEIIMAQGGTLDKYVGDAIMAVFGAPGTALKDTHAITAVRTACAMIARLHELHIKWKQEGREPFSIGIGINTGIMKVGNMGSKKLFDYTVIGDEVNAGARIESLTREYNVDIIISENTYLKVKDTAICRKLGETTVKGKKNPIVIYAVESAGASTSSVPPTC
ncbi:MAG: adenylate/guanylate cyclase domain-containing protein [Candidatus Auribacterota bacterium]